MKKSPAAWIWSLAILFFTGLMVNIILPYLSFRTDIDFLLTKQAILHVKPWMASFYLHIFSSSFVLLAGAVQFSTWIQKRMKKLHRAAGYMYVVIITGISGPAGLVMAFYANGGVWAKTSFVLLSLMWILFTFFAWWYAYRKDFRAHKSWMIRSYALTLSAISLRLMLLLIPQFVHLGAKPTYVMVSWLSWVLNLAIAESIIYSRRKKPVLIGA